MAFGPGYSFLWMQPAVASVPNIIRDWYKLKALNQSPRDKRGQIDYFMKKNGKRSLLKTLIKQMGWSNNAFARRWVWEKEDTDDETEIKQFEERFKKQLARETTNDSLIDAYIDFLFLQPEAKKLDVVKPVGEQYQDTLSDRFHRLSKKLNKLEGK